VKKVNDIRMIRAHHGKRVASHDSFDAATDGVTVLGWWLHAGKK